MTLTSTQAEMKLELSAEFDRTGDSTFDGYISTYISRAIDDHSRERFYFNVGRKPNFLTIIGQWKYTVTEDIWIPEMVEIDYVEVFDSGIQFQLSVEDPYLIENLNDITTPATGRPLSYALINGELWLYPVPDKTTYRVRVFGHYISPPPNNDGDGANDWMNKAFYVIKARAKIYLATEVTRNPGLAQAGVMLEQDALQRLRAETSKRTATGYVRATQF